MHELTLAKDLVRLLTEEANKKCLKRPDYARVRIGETRLHDKTELEELFISESKGTPIEGINLDIVITSLRAKCEKCNSDFDASSGKFNCNECGSPEIKITQGNEIIIEELRCTNGNS